MIPLNMLWVTFDRSRCRWQMQNYYRFFLRFSKLTHTFFRPVKFVKPHRPQRKIYALPIGICGQTHIFVIQVDLESSNCECFLYFRFDQSDFRKGIQKNLGIRWSGSGFRVKSKVKVAVLTGLLSQATPKLSNIFLCGGFLPEIFVWFEYDEHQMILQNFINLINNP